MRLPRSFGRGYSDFDDKLAHQPLQRKQKNEPKFEEEDNNSGRGPTKCSALDLEIAYKMVFW